MDTNFIAVAKSKYDELLHKEETSNVEFWYARDLMSLLGYGRWENFENAIGRAIISCESSKIAVSDHFREVTKMIVLGSGAQRAVINLMLTRCVC